MGDLRTRADVDDYRQDVYRELVSARAKLVLAPDLDPRAKRAADDLADLIGLFARHLELHAAAENRGPRPVETTPPESAADGDPLRHVRVGDPALWDLPGPDADVCGEQDMHGVWTCTRASHRPEWVHVAVAARVVVAMWHP